MLFLLLATLTYGQDNKERKTGSGEEQAVTIPTSHSPILASKMAPLGDTDKMEAAFRLHKVNFKRFSNTYIQTPGYYIISNIYSNEGYLAKNLEKLRKKGFEAGFLFNPEDQLNYLYLKRFDTWQEALEACNTNINQTYDKAVWVMIIPPSKGPAAANTLVSREKKPISAKVVEAAPLEIVSYENVTASGNSTPSVLTIRPVKSNSWINKANTYFDQMRYAEAAELYEKGLEKTPDVSSLEIFQKAGDAHYFNTNMERAYYWYHQLYKTYKADMRPEYLFKYAHTLKGAGKYGRAKRMMRLYNRATKNETVEEEDTSMEANANEVVLDNILAADDNAILKNLSINTRYSEFAPMFYKEDKMVFASSRDSSVFTTRRYGWNNQPFLDLYLANINEESQEMRNAIKLSKNINTKYHEASVTFSPDNTTMYFTRNNYKRKLRRDENGMNHLKIYVSNKVNGEWGEARELPFNSDSYSTGHPALSPDGKKLYFVSDMPGSMGETDIFVVDVLGNNQYSQPKNLGPKINTKRKEMFPFVTDEKLYFSSDGHVGLGGLDVYEAVLEEDGGFMDAVNLGRPINSEKDDFSYIVNENNNKGYFASNRNGGKGDDDLYGFERLIPEKTVYNAIAGTVVEQITGELMPNALVTLLDENNIKLKEIITASDGAFVFEDLESDTKYTVKIAQTEYFGNVKEVVTGTNEVVEIEIPMKKLKELIVVEEGVRKLKTDMIFFDFDKSYIRKDAAVELDKLVEVMMDHKDMVIKIESHTDSRGPAVYNKYLSDKRAKSSRDYLISKGISEERIESAIGYGDERLLNECKDGVWCTRERHELNRRSEFIIVKM